MISTNSSSNNSTGGFSEFDIDDIISKLLAAKR